MPWYWTDELARTLIDSGKADRRRLAGWLAAPVAIRRDQADPAEVAATLLDEEADPHSTWMVAA